ncbi:FHA domain-containing protein [Microbulbifer thermotolerans]|uniref:FHA domain-containing protein n=1 Tax=Microbulbifer thermotolerans TaxID=252514 RepID=A0AB35HT09_MICTH|nr:FHA domain-containing protein [Microbulbifer thermotolerans]MCX2779805.1 FHA domain-containing protein [Microbulbifer thermotolerans]MCX2784412.1 FHA domain-containing protein [Microbulbifer thermotolerans]MCX2794473.1 FHA domain-containing protein [Microbulbifer thermotolerans]MCX2800416.1 FHA domain-containing protein [Microbulbifer thermotolerans]MCX2832804.1 FHA domain-containing protein [Microbulbifer thermotolerans]
MFKLCDLKDASVSVWLVAPKVTIGRAGNCDLAIADESVAKLHAEVTVEGDVLTLHHLAESGQTLLNGTPVQGSCPLKRDDELQIGGRTLRVVDPKVTRLKKVAPASSVAWALRANHPAIAGKVFPIRESSVVGRSDDCDITFSLSHLSRRHARLDVREGLLFVTDLGSANGTYLNNKRITESRVRRGDELRFDTLSFSVVGPADDRNKTSVRPALASSPVKSEVGSAKVVKPAQTAAGEPTRERRKYENGGELADSGGSLWLWMGGLLVAAAALGFFWARHQGLL